MNKEKIRKILDEEVRNLSVEISGLKFKESELERLNKSWFNFTYRNKLRKELLNSFVPECKDIIEKAKGELDWTKELIIQRIIRQEGEK